jgi:ADP-ribose pyrophosphatase YjhB (NUDIX family)
MLKRLVGALWRRSPKGFRRFWVRTTQPHFTVAAAAVVLNDEGRILLLKHVFRPDSGWGIPGGFLNKEEQPEEAVRRELREEAGLELEEIELAYIRTLKLPAQIEIYYRARTTWPARPQSFEIAEAEWFSPANLPETLSSDQRQIIEIVLNARR